MNLKFLFFYITLICILSDIGGLIFGKIFKGPKLTKISPNKTISGAVGSMLFPIIFLILTLYYFSIFEYFNKLFFITLIAAIFTQLGDIFFSFLKRKAKLKDTGKILPGHGGLLDRVDGLLFGLPAGLFISLIIL